MPKTRHTQIIIPYLNDNNKSSFQEVLVTPPAVKLNHAIVPPDRILTTHTGESITVKPLTRKKVTNRQVVAYRKQLSGSYEAEDD
jgi:hypothetical protein